MYAETSGPKRSLTETSAHHLAHYLVNLGFVLRAVAGALVALL